jgi:hypothetical protein
MNSKIIGKTVNISQGLLKRLSRMYESNIPIKDISEQTGVEEESVKKLLKLLGYAVTD